MILENHLHAVAQADNLPKVWANFKSYTARKIIDHLQEQNTDFLLQRLAFGKKPHKSDRQFQFWQEGSHPQVMACPKVLRQKLQYIHENPVKRGYVELPEHWRYSSAQNYMGKQGLIEVFQDWY